MVDLPRGEPSVEHARRDRVRLREQRGCTFHPAWYYNLTTAGRAEVEIGTETFEVTVEEITGAERDRIYAEQARRYTGFAEYEEKTRGVRTIPVLALHRN